MARGEEDQGRFFAAIIGLQVGKTRSSDLFSIDDELIGDHQAPQAITVTLHTPNLGLNTNLAPNPVSLLNCAPPANTERQPIRESHGISAKVVRASFTIPRQGALSASDTPQRIRCRLVAILEHTGWTDEEKQTCQLRDHSSATS